MTKKEAVKVIDGRFGIMDYCESAKLEEALDIAIKALEQSEWKKGKWIFLEPNGFKCSECNKYLYIACGDVKMNFCPNCGAYMRSKEDER